MVHQGAQLQAQHKLPSWQIFGLLGRQVQGCGRLMGNVILNEATGAREGSKLYQGSGRAQQGAGGIVKVLGEILRRSEAMLSRLQKAA